MASDNSETLPDREQLLKAIETAQAAHKAQSVANDLKSKAKSITDNGEREKLLKEAYEKEVEANGLSKMAKRMQSGTWQGFGFGGGIGAATGLGLGAGIGTLLGAVTAIPTTGLGMLVGAGVGAVHGPWIKLGGKEQKFEDANPEELVDALQEEQDSQSQSEAQQSIADAGHKLEATNEGQQTSRRKPRKLEIRSQQNLQSQQKASMPAGKSSSYIGENADPKPKRKPKKLEIRSGKSGNTNANEQG